jgi:hypothetical protein
VKMHNSKIKSKIVIVAAQRKRVLRYLQAILVLLVLGSLLCYGASWQMFHIDSDVARYQCYAVAFWQGWAGLQQLPSEQCTFVTHPDQSLTFVSQDALLHAMRQWQLPSGLIQFVATQSPTQAYHALPYEYPWPMLLSYSLGLIAPAQWYQVAFAIWMLALAACIYAVLQRWRSRGTALAFALYLVAGGWATAVARFDLIPAALTLFAVMCADHKRWNWAFALLALAALSKFYPVTLLIPFLLALHQGTQGKWYAWRTWQPIAVFVGVCLLVMGISLILSVGGTLAPLGYFGNRPIQVESLSASMLWICSLLGKTSLTYAHTFASLNVLSPLSSNVTLLINILLVVGILYTWWLQWCKHIDLGMTCLLTLLIVIVTAKVFSPQYLIWVIPLAAYVGQHNRWWVLFWTIVGLLTSWIYPYIYHMAPSLALAPYVLLFYPATSLRNFLLLGFILAILIAKTRPRYPPSHSIEQPEYNGQETSAPASNPRLRVSSA